MSLHSLLRLKNSGFMAKILFLSLVFPPDNVSTAQIMGDLAVDLRNMGHDVEVLTTTPHYNRDFESEAKQPRHKLWGLILQKSSYFGIPVFHVIMPRKGSNILARVLAWLSFHFLSTVAGLLVLKRPDIIIVPSPPLTIGLNAWLLGLLVNSPYIYNVQEIYPDYAIELGVLRNKWIIKVLFWVESFVYDKAKSVTVIAPHMAQQLHKKRVPMNKVKVIPNFVDVNDLHPLPKDNSFSRQYGIHDKFVVSYAGNIGPGQDLETFIEAAAMLEAHRNIHFLMMGDGMLRETLSQKVGKLGLSNFSLLPYQPYSLVPLIYASSDLCLVPQKPGIANVAVPSKVYRIMACGRAVLAATVPASDLSNLIDESKGGIVVSAGDPKKLADVILIASLAPDDLNIMGRAGRAHVIEKYSRSAISLQYDALISTNRSSCCED